jgi:hypothetical protein
MAWTAAHARLLARHIPPARPPLEVSTGDRLRIGELSEEWPAFRWCSDEHGHGGWVPDRHLSHLSDGEATALQDHDTSELAADQGEIVSVDEPDEESGWLWCSNASGESGWIPLRWIEPVD